MKRIHKKSRMVKESSTGTLKDIERTYGKKTADALVEYCKFKKMDVDDVVSDLKEDFNGMTQWDKFDRWAKKTLGLDIMGGFDDTVDWTKDTDDDQDIRRRKRDVKIYDAPSARDMFGESNGMDAQSVLDFIAEELGECEWVADVEFDDYDAKCYIETGDGNLFTISVDGNM